MAIFGSKDFVKARGGKKQKDFVGTILGEILGSDCNFHQTLWGGEGVHICRVMVCSPCILPTHNMPWWKPCRQNHAKPIDVRHQLFSWSLIDAQCVNWSKYTSHHPIDVLMHGNALAMLLGHNGYCSQLLISYPTNWYSNKKLIGQTRGYQVW